MAAMCLCRTLMCVLKMLLILYNNDKAAGVVAKSVPVDKSILFFVRFEVT